MSTLVVGDVHGCSEELAMLLERAGAVDRVVFVGDLFTKGPDPVGVWEQVHAHEAVMGNHEVRLLAVAEGRRGDQRAVSTFERLSREAPGWLEWTAALPYSADVGDWLVVHAGVHPSGKLSLTTRKMFIAMRRFPQGDPDAPFWYDSYTGSRPVIFGHDAARGLVVRNRADGTPLVRGLDTGCVYGGRLTALVVDTGELLHVDAKRTYVDPFAAP